MNMKEKTFEYKGQMINYYNKVKENPKITWCMMAFEVGVGYVVRWCY